MKIENGTWIFESTGRITAPCSDVVGVATEGDTIYDGWDGTLSPSNPADEDEDDLDFAPSELAEIADMMIDRWIAFKDRQIAAMAEAAKKS